MSATGTAGGRPEAGTIRVGHVTIRREVGDAELTWEVAIGRGKSERHQVSRGESRLVIDMPVHARPKVLIAAALMALAAGGVMIGLLGLAAGSDGVPFPALLFAILVGVTVGAAIGYSLGHVREVMIVDSRLVTVSDTPFDFACLRRDVGCFVEFSPSSKPRALSAWGSPRVGIEPAEGAEAIVLPLGGSALGDIELEVLLREVNEFADSTSLDEEFAASEMAEYPAFATLTRPR